MIEDRVLLANFERLLEIGERQENESESTFGELWELLGFIDRHGRQLLELAKCGAGFPQEFDDDPEPIEEAGNGLE